MLLLSFSLRSSKPNLAFTIFFLVLFLSAFQFSKTLAKTKNRYDNKTLRIKLLNASDFSSISNGNGTIYMFWKEGSSPMQSKVFFAHVDLGKEYPSTIDGKNISNLGTVMNNPISASYMINEAIVAWKDYSTSFVGDLFMQRISGDQILWDVGGIRVTNSSEQLLNFSLGSDKTGNIFVTYITRSEYPLNDYKILYQRILSDGSLTYKTEPILVETSPRMKNNLKIVQDNNGGAFILWTEKINNKESLLLKKVDPSGKSVFGNKPLKISGTFHNTINFCESIINNSLLYIAWETSDKNIYHQLVNANGKAIWTVGGTKATKSRGTNTSPKVLQNDSLITLSWLNEFNQNRSLFVQKFKLTGKDFWTDKGIVVTSSKSISQNYSISDDNAGGLYIAWKNSMSSEDECNINIQRISGKGLLLWDSLTYSINPKTIREKGYLSVYPALYDRAAVIYEVLSDEILISQIKNERKSEEYFVELSTELSSRSVLLKLNTNFKDEKIFFILERLAHSDTSANIWEFIGTIDAKTTEAVKEYEFLDNPSEFGTLYYRAILKSNDKELLSNISRIDYLEPSSKIVVAQNNPNPFRDSTVINFYLPVSSTVGLEFFNEHAEKIGEVEEKIFPAGENNVTFYASGLPPGIYFFRFYSKDFIEVKKMVVD